MHEVRRSARRAKPWVLALTLVAFALRLPLNDSIPPRWDEGWSVAHALLALEELARIAAADVHPPLYYLLLKIWLALGGVDVFVARYSSVLGSTLSVPLAFVVARCWLSSRRVALLGAAAVAALPLAVYYGAVVRMYAFVPTWVLLAMYGALRARFAQSGVWLLALGALGAVLTLYHAAWALLGLALALGMQAALSRDWVWLRRMFAGSVLAVVGYAPWLIYAAPQVLSRAQAESMRNVAQQLPLTYFIDLAVRNVALSQPSGDAAFFALIVVLVVGWAVALVQRRGQAQPLLPLAMLAFTVLGVAFAARFWTLNARMLIGATPALALWLGWSLDRLAAVQRSLALVASGALVAAHIPSFGVTYAKSLEVFDPYDPHQYCARIAPLTQRTDVVVFNVLSPAGFYALDCRESSPPWSYALTWDPVIEPRMLWEARLSALAQQHSRLWLVLYRGLAGHNGDLRGWADTRFFPAYGAWSEEGVFFGLYGTTQPTVAAPLPEDSWEHVRLVEARTVRAIRAGHVLPLGLTWRADAPVQADYKVFVHARAPDGRLIAQHDAMPLNDLRPMTRWQVSERVYDAHGLALPLTYQGALEILVGLYDPRTGARLITRSGADALTVAHVQVSAP
ncbi:MAG: glycosyltransferase family 39 protein [Anaerolineae bacterium]|nr:glycosyltransferase family 39 protein [Anaerolineae bacterium]